MVNSALLGLAGVLTAAIVGTGIWAWAPDRSLAELEKKYWDSSTRYIEVAGTSIRVRESGNSHGPAVIMLHGFGSSLETWEPWARAIGWCVSTCPGPVSPSLIAAAAIPTRAASNCSSS